jgi:hypothetical protein
MVPVPPPVFILDGHQIPKVAMDTLGADAVEALHIMCWNSADSTFSAAHGGQGLNVVVIVTKGLAERLVGALHQAAEAASQSSAISAPVGDAPRTRTVDNGIVVELSADRTQWSATLKRGALVHRCVLDVSRSAMPSTEAQRTCDVSVAEGERFVLTSEG